MFGISVASVWGWFALVLRRSSNSHPTDSGQARIPIAIPLASRSGRTQQGVRIRLAPKPKHDREHAILADTTSSSYLNEVQYQIWGKLLHSTRRRPRRKTRTNRHQTRTTLHFRWRCPSRTSRRIDKLGDSAIASVSLVLFDKREAKIIWRPRYRRN